MKAYIISGIYSPTSEWKIIDVCSSATEADRSLDRYRSEGSAYEKVRVEIWEYNPSKEDLDPQTIETYHKVVLSYNNAKDHLDDARHDIFKSIESLRFAEMKGGNPDAVYIIKETSEVIMKMVETQADLIDEMLDRYKDDSGIKEASE